MNVSVGCPSLLLVAGFHLLVVGLFVDCRCWLSFATLGCWLSSVFCRVSVVDCQCWLSFAIVGCCLPCVGCRVSVVDCRLLTVGVGCRCRLLVAGCHVSVVGYRLMVVVCFCWLLVFFLSVVDCRCRLSFAFVGCWLSSVICRVSVVDCRSLLSIAGCDVSFVGYRLLIVVESFDCWCPALPIGMVSNGGQWYKYTVCWCSPIYILFMPPSPPLSGNLVKSSRPLHIVRS